MMRLLFKKQIYTGVGYMLGKWTKYWILVKIYVKYQYLKFYIMNSSMWWKVFKLKWFKGVK